MKKYCTACWFIYGLLFAEVPTNYVVTKDIYSLKDESEIIWEEELVVYDKYGTLDWQIYKQTNKNHKTSSH
jgi:hypothetical protein